MYVLEKAQRRKTKGLFLTKGKMYVLEKKNDGRPDIKIKDGK